MPRQTFRASERLGHRGQVEAVFATGKTLRPRSVPEAEQVLRVRFRSGSLADLHGPLSASAVPPARVQVLFAVPKKRFKRAHDRNQVRRHLREAYRHHRDELVAATEATGRHVLLVVLVQATAMPPAAVLAAQLAECLGSVAHQLRKLGPPAPENLPPSGTE
ncbi:MAG: ribonuclease P protein component [Bacteroidia bacterium]|nr:ribonuclease P protein component [Bacteroidia bacterium]